MSGVDERPAARILRGIVAGVVAGAAASFVMDRFQASVTALSPPSGSGDDEEPSTQRAADELARTVTGKEVPSADKPLAGQAVHYGLGIGLGVAYAIAAEFRPAVTAGYGTAFGVVTATVLDETIVPPVVLGEAPWQADRGTMLYAYISHLVFGGTAEFVRRQVRSTLVA